MSGAEDPNWELPPFELTELRPKVSKHCVVIPVINEGERIRTQLTEMTPLASTLDVIIADAGSTDGSLDLDFLRKSKVRALLVKKGGGRVGAQLRMAFGWAMRQGYEGIVLIDGNNKDNWEAIPDFVRALEEGFDHVQGSRFVPGGQAINTPWQRYWGLKLVHAPLLSLAAGYRYTDTTNGYRAYSRNFLLDERVQPFRGVFESYEIHYYLAIAAARLGFRVKELPVIRRYPATGPIPTKLSPLRGNAHMLKTLVSACLRRFDP
jgi:dolichol-phosphate mannosyltransferase